MDDLKTELVAICERMWQDVKTQPWQDPGYTQNEEAQRLAKQHFVQATASDLEDIFKRYKEAE